MKSFFTAARVAMPGLFAGVCVAALGANGALAGSYGLHEQSAEALGESFAGVAAGAGGLSAMFWNPATLTNNAGMQSSSSLSLLIPYSAPTFTGTNAIGAFAGIPALSTGTNQFVAPVALPASYSSYQVNDKLWFGLAVNTPFGLSTKNPLGSSAELWGLTTTVFTTDINPQIAYKINDWISVGAGLQIEYMETRQTAALAPIANPPVAQLKGSSWGVGFNLGVTVKPIDGTEIGIGYRSQVREGLTGNLTGVAPVAIPVSAPLTLPDSINVGLRQRISPQFTLLAGLEWTDWSKEQSLVVSSNGGGIVPAGAVIQTLAFNYRDGWMFSLGGEYKLDQRWTLRAGVAYEQSPVTNANRNVTLLDSDRYWLSLGASYQYNEKLKFDISYAHVIYASGTISIPASAATALFTPYPITYNANSAARGDVVSIGFTYRFDTPVAAVVAKY